MLVMGKGDAIDNWGGRHSTRLVVVCKSVASDVEIAAAAAASAEDGDDDDPPIMPPGGGGPRGRPSLV